MPTEPRIPTEPTLEELSAYLDHELDSDSQARVAEHIATCQDCQARLDGLRQAAYAVRGLPMETPPRPFMLPAPPPRPAWNWAPAGWIASGAAATLLVVFGLSHVHFPAGGIAPSGAGTAMNAPARSSGEAAPLSQSDARVGSQAYAPTSTKSVAVPGNPSRVLTIAADTRSYPSNGVLHLQVATRGISASEASTIRIFLARERGQGGYAIRLAPPTSAPSYPLSYDAAYSIAQLPLPAPVAGDYTLTVEIDLSDGSTLINSLPVTVTA